MSANIYDSVFGDEFVCISVASIPLTTKPKPAAMKVAKTAVMLPMMVPAKRGRGRAMTRGHPVAMPSSATPRRLQRVIATNAVLRDSLALLEEQKSLAIPEPVQVVKEVPKDTAQEKLNEDNDNVDDKKIEDCDSIDDDFREQFQSGKVQSQCGATERQTECEDVSVSGSYENGNKHSSDPDARGGDSDSLDFEDGELLEDEDMERRDGRLQEEPGQLFDKIPTYYTALSIPRKQFRKTASCVYGRGGISVHDYMHRDISPVRDTSTSKLPEYFSSFTNSTKYDSVATGDGVAGGDVGSGLKVTDESKASSGYSSLSPSPTHTSRSRSRSHSSHSVTHSHIDR